MSPSELACLETLEYSAVGAGTGDSPGTASEGDFSPSPIKGRGVSRGGREEALAAEGGSGDEGIGTGVGVGGEDGSTVSMGAIEEQCAICLTEFENGDVLRKMPW